MKVKMNHEYAYDVQHLLKIFGLELEKVEDSEELLNTVTIEGEIAFISASIGETRFDEQVDATSKRSVKRANSRVVYDVISTVLGKTSPYGTLVGVRPVKLVHEMLDQGFEEDVIRQKLYDNHRISPEKLDLLIEIGKREQPFLKDKFDDKNLSMYICIPFCPTRCLYCSFPSNDLRQKGKLVDAYLTCLHKEIDAAYELIKTHDKLVDCIYIGGGTPSILSAEQFEELIGKLNNYFNLTNLKEFTVEAGRPDTITEDKLAVLEKYHVSRICINPQSMNGKTLQLIGRDHTVEAIDETYKLSRNYAFDSINMDLILGLPDEDLEDVKATIDHIVALNPENVTIHTLAVKTSSRLKEMLDKYKMTQSDLVEEMLKYSETKLRACGYVPYYMYRQKNMVGNFENVGYCKEGKESLYNIRIIEEQHSILALGAGAVSKRCFPDEDRFERIANVKGIEDYISRIDDVIKKSATFFKI